MLLHDLLDDAVRATPDAAAVGDTRGSWTYRQLGELTGAVADWLAAGGVGPADRVVVQLPTTPHLAALVFGCSRRGAVFVPLDPAMRPFQLRTVLRDAEPRLVIGADSAVESLRELAGVEVHGFSSMWREVEALRAIAGRRSHPRAAPEDLALLIYTSGSTATPKAVACPHKTVVFAASAIQAELRYTAEDIVLSRLPMSWDYGLYQIFLCCLGLSTLVVAHGESDLVLARRISESGATVLPVVPSLATMIVTLAQRQPGLAFRVRMLTSTGGVLPDSTIGALRRVFPGARVVRQFGLTECKRITIMPPELDDARPGSVGRALRGTEVRILDPADRPVPAGHTGEIVVTGPHVMAGYWRAPELTAHTFRVDRHGVRHLHTGDYGYLDEDGYLYFEGRKDNVFKRRGVRMSTVEIEAAALDIPGVRAAAAMPPTGQRDLALCVAGELTSTAVLRELRGRLEPAKVPATCLVLPEFPLTTQGKHAMGELALLLDGAER